jgi:hypothetical protein
MDDPDDWPLIASWAFAIGEEGRVNKPPCPQRRARRQTHFSDAGWLAGARAEALG